jgi:hypothetical protein
MALCRREIGPFPPEPGAHQGGLAGRNRPIEAKKRGLALLEGGLEEREGGLALLKGGLG